MTDKIPKVSIGLVVFNGEKYLAQAIDSILGHCLRVIDRAPLSLSERIACYWQIFDYLVPDFLRDGFHVWRRALWLRKSTIDKFKPFIVNIFPQ